MSESPKEDSLGVELERANPEECQKLEVGLKSIRGKIGTVDELDGICERLEAEFGVRICGAKHSLRFPYDKQYGLYQERKYLGDIYLAKGAIKQGSSEARLRTAISFFLEPELAWESCELNLKKLFAEEFCIEFKRSDLPLPANKVVFYICKDGEFLDVVLLPYGYVEEAAVRAQLVTLLGSDN